MFAARVLRRFIQGWSEGWEWSGAYPFGPLPLHARLVRAYLNGKFWAFYRQEKFLIGPLTTPIYSV